MKRPNLGRAVLTASLIAAGVQAPCLIGSAAAMSPSKLQALLLALAARIATGCSRHLQLGPGD